jgi:hypothetical protein
MVVMTNKKFVEKCIDIAKNYKTLYVMGCFGAPMNEANKVRYCNNHSYNKKASRKKMIQAATADTFGFDCVNLIKGILWGWSGDKTKTYGGAKYASNGVPDTNADGMIKLCKDVSTDFSKIEIGEAVWLKGHIGIYIGDGLAVECTPAWDNCVQITACNCDKKGYNRRNWTKHGKLPYITYEKDEIVPEKPSIQAVKSVTEVAKDVINGKYGNGAERKKNLESAGYNYAEVQAEVNRLLSPKKEPLEKVAKDTINGKYGNGEERKKRIPAETGYTFREVQNKVNEILKNKE